MGEIIMIIVLILLVIVAIPLAILTKVSALNRKIDKVDDNLKTIQSTLKRLQNIPVQKAADKPQSAPEVEKPIAPVKEVLPPPMVEEKPIEPKVPAPEPIQPQEPVVKEPTPLTPVKKPVPAPSLAFHQTTHASPKAMTSQREKTAPPKPHKPSFFERNPDLEKFIGENLISKIGIVIFVIGMGFLVKLGIDNDYITEPMRVALGILIGGGLVGLAHYLRKSFTNFSSILIGGGLAVLYFSIALAFHDYQLIPQTAAFLMMVVITGFAVLLSLAYDRKVLAVLALVGGFGTPFFVSTGTGNYIALFTYLLILDIGMVTLVYFKKWNIINYLSYAFTYVLIFGVYSSLYIGNEDEMRLPFLGFASGFFLVFFLMNIIHNVRHQLQFKFPDLSILITNSGMYFGLGLTLLSGLHDGLYSGLFTTILAVFNLVVAFIFFKRKDTDKNLFFLLVGLVLTFISLIAPIQLEGNFITLFWSIEGLLLLWLGHKSGIQLMKGTAMIIGALTIISLAMDWNNAYSTVDFSDPLPVLLNKAFVLSAVVLVAHLIAILKTPTSAEIEVYKSPADSIQIPWRKMYIQVTGIVVLYLAFALELHYQSIRFELETTTRALMMGTYNSLFGLGMVLGAVRNSSQIATWIINLSAVILTGLMFFNHSVTLEARNLYITTNGILGSGFFWHYAMLAMMLVVVVAFVRRFKLASPWQSQIGQAVLVAISAWTVFTVTSELEHLSFFYQGMEAIQKGNAHDVASRSVYPIVWGLTALGLMLVGMKLRLRVLRLSSLALFCITIIKLFVYDLQGNTTGKVVSFTLLGVILLVISFLYQKLKFIVQDDQNDSKS